MMGKRSGLILNQSAIKRHKAPCRVLTPFLPSASIFGKSKIPTAGILNEGVGVADRRARLLQVEKLEIPGALRVKPSPFMDNRGMFRRHYCQQTLEDFGFKGPVLQSNISENPYKGTLRGFHYQMPPHCEGKYLTCLRGSIYNVIVDLRKDSSMFGRWVSIELNGDNRDSIYIPKGCTNAFLTTSDDVLVYYLANAAYFSDSERGIRWNDEFFNIEWPMEPVHISAKDSGHSDFDPEGGGIVNPG